VRSEIGSPVRGFTLRIGGFLLLTTVGAVVGALIWGSGMIGGFASILFGSLLGGWVLLRIDGRSPGALGFHGGLEAVRGAVLGTALGTLLVLVAVAFVFVAGGVRWELAEEGGYVLEGLRSLGFFALPAAAEEALFRGYPLQLAAGIWGGVPALVVTSVAFGLLHLPNPEAGALPAANVAAAGLLLGVVYLRTGSLWWASGVHLGWNWGQGFLADLPVSGLRLTDAPGYDAVARGPEWISGAGFGVEGSAVTTALLLLAALWLWRVSWLRPAEGICGLRPLAPIKGCGEVEINSGE
jgi:membrane protease YdiL (CAAX protease family)